MSFEVLANFIFKLIERNSTTYESTMQWNGMDRSILKITGAIHTTPNNALPKFEIIYAFDSFMKPTRLSQR